MAKTGRPSVEIDQQQFEKLCAMQCTETEIAAWFGCSIDTINRWCKRTYSKRTFADVFKEKREGGKASLRATQFKLAQKSAAMAIFLGKNWLGQTDRIEQTTLAISDEARQDVERLLSDD